ncbi:NAD(P)-binding domain-containing protein [Spirosoma jeollabukense]
MKIAIIGTGNLGGALAQRFVQAGHTVLMGANFPLSEKSILLATKIGADRFTSIKSAVTQYDVVILATPALKAIDVAQALGDATGKVIIDRHHEHCAWDRTIRFRRYNGCHSSPYDHHRRSKML